MTDPEQPDFKADARACWNQARAVDLCRALSAGDLTAANQIIAEVTNDNEADRLVAGLAWAANSLAKTVAAQHPTATEAQVWATLGQRAITGVHTSMEISRMIDSPNQEGTEQ